MKISIALQVAAAVALVAVAVMTFPAAEVDLPTVNDRAAWGYDESGNLVNPPAPPIEITLK